MRLPQPVPLGLFDRPYIAAQEPKPTPSPEYFYQRG
jgi:hypothetical protein